MRRPNVYQRSAPRVGRAEMSLLGGVRGDVARGISQGLPSLIDRARSAGLDRLADALDVARVEAEIGMGRAGLASVIVD